MSTVTITTRLKKETDKAIAIVDERDVDGPEKLIWLPKSQIEYEASGHIEGAITVEIPEWLAKEKELV